VCNARNNVFTGYMPDIHPFGSAKLALLLDYSRTHDFIMNQTTAYAGSHYNQLILEGVGRPAEDRPS